MNSRPKLKADRRFIDRRQIAMWWLDATLRALPATTALGFMLGLCVLNQVFDQWGLSAFQLVGPGDVLIPSLMIAIGASILITLPTSVALLLDLCISGLDQSKKRWLTDAATLVPILAWPIIIFPETFAHVPRAAIVIMIMIGSGGALWTLVDSSRSRPRAIWHRIVVIVASLSIVTWWGITATEGFNMIVRNGLVRGARVEAAGEKADRPPCPGVLLWLGEKAAVIRCDAPSNNIRVTTTIDELVLYPTSEVQQVVRTPAA